MEDERMEETSKLVLKDKCQSLGRKQKLDLWVPQATADERTGQDLKLLLKAAGGTAINHGVCRKKSPGVRGTVAQQRVVSDQYVCELREQKEKSLEK